LPFLKTREKVAKHPGKSAIEADSILDCIGGYMVCSVAYIKHEQLNPMTGKRIA